jgi:hypothetical protein
MNTSDVIGLVLFASVGAWWLFAPQSVINFYIWFCGPRLRVHPNSIGIRVAGFLWMVLVVGVVLNSSSR